MRTQLIRLIKAFCPDFQPIRRILTGIGAVWVEQTEQSDYFFGYPSARMLQLRAA